jgi:hypothetical protein
MGHGTWGHGTIYNEDDAQFFLKCPLESMLVISVGSVAGCGLAVLCTGRGAFLLNEDVCNEIVDDGRADGRICSGPQHHARRGQNLECV